MAGRKISRGSSLSCFLGRRTSAYCGWGAGRTGGGAGSAAGPADGWLRKVVYAGNQRSAATQLVHAPRSADEGSERE